MLLYKKVIYIYKRFVIAKKKMPKQSREQVEHVALQSLISMQSCKLLFVVGLHQKMLFTLQLM